MCSVSLVTACFLLYGCLSCSDLQLDRCQPPNTLSNTGGIYTQVQPDIGHNACGIKGQGCSFGSHPLAYEREWQSQIRKRKTRWRICTAAPDESDGQLHIWHDWLIRFVDCKAIYVFSCSLSGLDKGKMGWDSLDRIPENKHAHAIKTRKKKEEKKRGLSHKCTDTCICFQWAVGNVTSSSSEKASASLSRLCTNLLLSYAHVYPKQIHALYFKTSVEGFWSKLLSHDH